MSGSNKPDTSPFYRSKGHVVVFRVDDMVQKEIQVLAVDAHGVRDTGQRIALKAGPASIRAAR